MLILTIQQKRKVAKTDKVHFIRLTVIEIPFPPSSQWALHWPPREKSLPTKLLHWPPILLIVLCLSCIFVSDWKRKQELRVVMIQSLYSNIHSNRNNDFQKKFFSIHFFHKIIKIDWCMFLIESVKVIYTTNTSSQLQMCAASRAKDNGALKEMKQIVEKMEMRLTHVICWQRDKKIRSGRSQTDFGFCFSLQLALQMS